MVVDLGNAGPMVKLAVALLDDKDGQGITEDALLALKAIASMIDDLSGDTSADLYHIWKMVKGTDGRCYLREGWNDKSRTV